MHTQTRLGERILEARPKSAEAYRTLETLHKENWYKVVPASGSMYTRLETRDGRLRHFLKRVRQLQVYLAELSCPSAIAFLPCTE